MSAVGEAVGLGSVVMDREKPFINGKGIRETSINREGALCERYTLNGVTSEWQVVEENFLANQHQRDMNYIWRDWNPQEIEKTL